MGGLKQVPHITAADANPTTADINLEDTILLSLSEYSPPVRSIELVIESLHV